MEKLNKIGANFKQGARAIILGAALVSAPVSCKQPTGGTVIENPDNPEIKPEVKYKDESYDKIIGNGNYFLHSFLGENTTFSRTDAFDATNFHLANAEKWTDDYIDNFEKSLADRPAALEYWKPFIDGVRGRKSHFKFDKNHLGGGNDFDNSVNAIIKACEPYFPKFIKNLDTIEQCYDFQGAFPILLLQERYLAWGSTRSQSVNSKYYNDERKKRDRLVNSNIDIKKEYGENNFTGITYILDDEIVYVVDKMNNSNDQLTNEHKNEDWQTFFNFAIITDGYYATNNRMSPSVGHDGYCNMFDGVIKSAIDRSAESRINKIYKAQQEEQLMTY